MFQNIFKNVVKVLRKSPARIFQNPPRGIPGKLPGNPLGDLRGFSLRNPRPHFDPPPCSAPRPAQLDAANGPDKTSHRVRNNDPSSEQEWAAERSEAALRCTIPPFLSRRKGDGTTKAPRSPKPISSSRPSPGGLLRPPQKLVPRRAPFLAEKHNIFRARQPNNFFATCVWGSGDHVPKTFFKMF